MPRAAGGWWEGGGKKANIVVGLLLLVVQQQIGESLLSKSPREGNALLKQFLTIEFVPFFTIWLKSKGLHLIYLQLPEV